MCQFHGESATFKLNPVNHGHQAGTKKTPKQYTHIPSTVNQVLSSQSPFFTHFVYAGGALLITDE